MLPFKAKIETMLLGDQSQMPTVAADAHIRDDSRMVRNGDVFVDVYCSVEFCKDAIHNGAALVFADQSVAEQVGSKCIAVSSVVDVLNALLGARYARIMEVPWIGVTGTNGKTSIAWMIAQAVDRALYVGTLGMWFDRGMISELSNTTPRLCEILPLIDAQGLVPDCVVFEVSSIGIDQKRVEAVDWSARVLTNITRDHIDYHQSFDRYARCKLDWFLQPDSDDGKKVHLFAQFDAQLAKHANSTRREIHLYGDAQDGFMALNQCGAQAVIDALGLRASQPMSPPPGRLEQVSVLQGTAIVDYAHTPDAIDNLLRSHAANLEKFPRSTALGRVFTVVGAGGDRDVGKRPLMARAALERSHVVIFTSDNPRSEQPEAIIDDMLAVFDADPIVYEYRNDGKGLEWYRIEDRRVAIGFALDQMSEGDTLYVVGKGHENYQEIQGVRNAFSDREVIESYVAAHTRGSLE